MKNIQYLLRKIIKLFFQNNRNLFEFMKMRYAKFYEKLKKDAEIHIIKNSKKFLGGNIYGRIDK